MTSLRLLLALAAVALLAAPPAAGGSSGPTLALSLGPTGPSATYPTCAGWMDVTASASSASTLASLRLVVSDAQGLAWNATDLPAGVATERLSLAVGFEGANGTPMPAGDYAVTLVGSDAEGTASVTQTLTLAQQDDAQAPLAGVSLSRGTQTGEGWYAGKVRVAAFATDDCRVASLALEIDGVAAGTAAGVSAPGWHVAHVVARDLADNAAEATASFGIDATAPAVRMLSPSNGSVSAQGDPVAQDQPVTVSVGRTHLLASASDDLSGVADVAWIVDGAVVAHGQDAWTWLAPGRHTILVTASDLAGNAGRDGPLAVVAASVSPPAGGT